MDSTTFPASAGVFVLGMSMFGMFVYLPLYLQGVRPGEPSHEPGFIICRGCRAVAETDVSGALLEADAAEIGFAVERTVMEVEGLCPKCRKVAP